MRRSKSQQDNTRSKKRGANLAKLAMLHHYGPYCRCCRDKNIDNLCVDHPDGKGAKHRAQLAGNGTRGGYKVYADIIRRGFPKGFSVLCRTCNSSKGTGKYCKVHKKHRDGSLVYLQADSGRPKLHGGED